MDVFRIAGAETAAGFVAGLGSTDTHDTEGPLVKHMRSLGAIPICKTNVPQSMMLANTTNNIFGNTLNPYDRRLSAGGAAGGEGALLALRGSPLGWATEIAGSTRIPGLLNKLFALKVSTGRLPTLGVVQTSTAWPICNTTVGILSTDPFFLQYVARWTLGSQAYQEDPNWLDVPWREAKFLKFKLLRRRPTFAILADDGYVQPQPPLQRALTYVAQSLRNRGYEVIDWKPPSHAKAVENMFRMIGADGAQDVRTHISASGEPPVQQLKKWYLESAGTESLSTGEYWSLCKSWTDYNASYASYWKSTEKMLSTRTPVDGVIMPVIAHASCFETDLNYFGYSAIVNHLDFTSVAIPVTHGNANFDIRVNEPIVLSEEDARVQSAYDPKIAHRKPVGLQIMCRRLEEETFLALAQIVAQVLY